MRACREQPRVRAVADAGALVLEALTAAEVEGFVASIIGPELREPGHDAAVGEDIEEPQEFLVMAGLY